MKAMESLEDLIEEAKVRTLWWALCIFGIAYFLTRICILARYLLGSFIVVDTSKSMWMNLPISILFVYALRILFNEVEFRPKMRAVRPQTYLSHLEKKQLSVNDSRLVSATLPSRWKRKIDSPIVEAAMKDFIDKILKDFVVDLWYSEITQDTEFPEQIRSIIMDALGEVTGRVKEMNLVDLLMRDLVDLVGDHLDLFRRNQAAIGVDVMGILSSEERDERLKHHLMASRELHPALLSPESEYKVLQRLTSGVLAEVLRPRETQCPVVRSIARELLTSLVMQPILNFASPGYINELIEYVLLATKVDSNGGEADNYQSKDAVGVDHNHSITVSDDNSNKRKYSSINQGADSVCRDMYNLIEKQPSHVEWARMLDVATQRRTEVLMPENLENMWTKGRNYKKKENKSVKLGVQESISKDLTVKSGLNKRDPNKEILTTLTSATEIEADLGKISMPGKSLVSQLSSPISYDNQVGMHSSINPQQDLVIDRVHLVDKSESNRNLSVSGATLLKRSNSTSALRTDPGAMNTSTGCEGAIISEFYTPNVGRPSEGHPGRSASDMVVRKEGQLVSKLRCRVMGAYFEKLGSKSFAVYSIAVTDAEKRTWFVKRRYKNFECLHRYLKDIPNYTLHLPPKRIFSSSTEDTFVHQRCIQLDKYLLDLLSIANVAEQHEVWDFLSASSKNYSFGKSSSVMRTLAVNVDDAVDDIVRQFKGVSDGLIRKVVGSPSPAFDASSSISDKSLSLNPDDLNQHISRHYSADVANSYSDNEEDGKDQRNTREDVSGWHSDTELNAKSFPPRVVKRVEENRGVHSDKKLNSGVKYGIRQEGVSGTSYDLEDVGVPPEWTPPNVSVPLLNLVDKIFQLNRRGWIRRQVLWISKQILQLIMEDALDDWLLRQIHWLRRDDIIAEGIRWVQDILWPDGTFFLRLRDVQCESDDTQHDKSSFQTTSQPGGSKFSKPGSFEEQLEAARRASTVKKMLFDGAPTTLVSLIGHKQYKRCAKDIYYFTQSTICVKQLAFGILELLLISIFPELRKLVLEVHEKMHVPQPV